MEEDEVLRKLRYPATKHYIGCGPNASRQFNACRTCGDCLYCKKAERRFFKDWRVGYCTRLRQFVRTTDEVPPWKQ